MISRVTRRLMLLDTASLYFRAFFGVPDVRAPDGTPVNAVRGLLDFIASLLNRYAPTDLVCCWDDDWRPSWRVALIPSYKAHRVVAERTGAVDIEVTPDLLQPQIPVIEEVLDALGLAVVGADQAEADDVIATLATTSSVATDVVTGDRDLFQLNDDDRGIRVLYTGRGVGRLEEMDAAALVTKYGILPEQYAAFAVLRGDPSDGLPGVKGVGDKTATALLRQYADLDGVLAAASDGGSGLASSLRAKILAAQDYLTVATRVVEVARDLTLPAVESRLRPVPDEVVEALAERLGLGSSVRRAAIAIEKAASAGAGSA